MLVISNKNSGNPSGDINSGQLLIGILIGIAVFSILIHTVFTLIRSSFELVAINRGKVTARLVAQEKIENIRNMNYDDVGTVGGIPDGIIPQEEKIERNDIEMTINTTVRFIDDPFDGEAPADLNPEDYKQAQVEVIWEGLNQNRNSPITFVTDVAPGTVTSTTGGTLRILVFDANSNPVSDANVHIVAGSVDPPVDTSELTDSQGEVVLPGAEPCNECYEITVTKEGYNSDRTYSISEVSSPNKPHASVILGDVTQVSFAIDLVSSINISSNDSRDNDFADLGDVPFRLRGEKIIGYDGTGSPVYKYDENLTTDASGSLTLDDMEWDVYHLSMPDPSVYTISGTNPLQPLPVSPGSNINWDFSVEPFSQHSLLTIVKDESQNKLEDVFVRLYDGSTYDESTTSGKIDNPDHGQLLFGGLDDSTTYDLQATASGYLDLNTTVSVSGATVNEIIMKQ